VITIVNRLARVNNSGRNRHRPMMTKFPPLTMALIGVCTMLTSVEPFTGGYSPTVWRHNASYGRNKALLYELHQMQCSNATWATM